MKPTLDAALEAAKGEPQKDGAPFPPPVPGPSSSASSGAAFSEAQLKQLNEMFGMVGEQCKTEEKSEEAREDVPRRVHGKGGQGPPKELSGSQIALIKSMFGGRIQVKSGTFEEFFKQVESKWQFRQIPDTMSSFLREPGDAVGGVPRGKRERATAFWAALKGLN